MAVLRGADPDTGGRIGRVAQVWRPLLVNRSLSGNRRGFLDDSDGVPTRRVGRDYLVTQGQKYLPNICKLLKISILV